MRSKFNLAVAVFLIGAVAASAPEDQHVRKDMDQMQGEWTMSSGSVDGYEIPDQMKPRFKRVCKSNETTVTIGKQLVMRATITIDPSKTPKKIDYEVIDGPTKGKKHLGIYELDGDTLKSCFAAPDQKRPTDFITKEGDHRTLTVWKRAKKQ